MKKIGFTGTREGMTGHQITELILFFDTRMLTVGGKDVEFHHGCCVGADEQASIIAKSIGCKIVAHPPVDTKLQSALITADEWRDPLGYIKRNHAIVDETEVLIAMPKQDIEQMRSGTWATVRYARQMGKSLMIIRPNEKGD